MLELPDGDVVFYPVFFAAAEADRLLRELRDTTAWLQEAVRLYRRSVALPRLTAWYGDAGTGYICSGIENDPAPWTPALLEVKRAVAPVCGVAFNSVLLNRYRTGRDGVAWHSDDEKEFDTEPVIASVSFGGTRTLQFRHKRRKGLRASVELTHGSLLVMRGATHHRVDGEGANGGQGFVAVPEVESPEARVDRDLGGRDCRGDGRPAHAVEPHAAVGPDVPPV